MCPAIELLGVGKRYWKLEQRPMLLKALVPFHGEARRELWALHDIDLRVEHGETLGILGHNGAGKTTLLRLLAGVTRPTVGRVRVRGRIGPLIGLGVGFHHEMSGRENVLVNGMMLGLTAREVLTRFDQIVSFAELEQFIDTPVKFYSSGMFARLGFAVVAHTDPTILLIDEILAVGDARFQLKCFDRLRELRQQGATVLMVSHSMAMVRQLCQRAVVIRHGAIVYDGGVERAIAAHEQGSVPATHEPASTPVEFVEFGFMDGEAGWRPASYDEQVELRMRVRFHQRVEDPVITVGALTNLGMFGGFNATPVGGSWRTFEPEDEADVRISFPVRFGGGTYRLIVDVKDRRGVQILARRDDLTLTVTERTGCRGMLDLGAEFTVQAPALDK